MRIYRITILFNGLTRSKTVDHFVDMENARLFWNQNVNREFGIDAAHDHMSLVTSEGILETIYTND